MQTHKLFYCKVKKKTKQSEKESTQYECVHQVQLVILTSSLAVDQASGNLLEVREVIIMSLYPRCQSTWVDMKITNVRKI